MGVWQTFSSHVTVLGSKPQLKLFLFDGQQNRPWTQGHPRVEQAVKINHNDRSNKSKIQRGSTEPCWTFSPLPFSWSGWTLLGRTATALLHAGATVSDRRFSRSFCHLGGVRWVWFWQTATKDHKALADWVQKSFGMSNLTPILWPTRRGWLRLVTILTTLLTKYYEIGRDSESESFRGAMTPTQST